jgi:hypothetical protein
MANTSPLPGWVREFEAGVQHAPDPRVNPFQAGLNGTRPGSVMNDRAPLTAPPSLKTRRLTW